MDEKKIAISRQVVEHTVLFCMPHLQSDKEALILQGLHYLQFEYKEILQLSAGRVLANDNFCTHALVCRFPSSESLLQYYKSQSLANIAAKMIPFLHREYTVDYMVSVTDDDNIVLNRKGSFVHITFLKVKADVRLEALEDMLESLTAMAQGLNYVTDLTAVVLQDPTFMFETENTHMLLRYIYLQVKL